MRSAAVGEVPAERDREARGVARAEVVAVGLALGARSSSHTWERPYS